MLKTLVWDYGWLKLTQAHFIQNSSWIFKNKYLFKKIYVLYTAHCSFLQTHQKRASDPITDGCEPQCGGWELNSGPLEEQSVLLTSEPSLQYLKQFLKGSSHSYLPTEVFWTSSITDSRLRPKLPALKQKVLRIRPKAHVKEALYLQQSYKLILESKFYFV